MIKPHSPESQTFLETLGQRVRDLQQTNTPGTILSHDELADALTLAQARTNNDPALRSCLGMVRHLIDQAGSAQVLAPTPVRTDFLQTLVDLCASPAPHPVSSKPPLRLRSLPRAS